MKPSDFRKAFKSLTDNDPFPWQQRLYRRFADNDIPDTCCLPTGIGKTSVIAIWLIALANHSEFMPRRLAYVVNRRTVVDQTTEEVKKYRDNLEKAGLNQCLVDLCALPLRSADGKIDPTVPPLAISTLRGQYADNREWSADPCRPAVICGTVDMIGSRLLFGGYGVGFKLKPLHAGFFGRDTLVVHDEAHLEPAFQKLLLEVKDEQKSEQIVAREAMRLRVMELTATSRDASTPFELQDDDLADAEIDRRLNAKKKLALHAVADDKKCAERIIELAKGLDESRAAVLIFVRMVEDVEKIVKKLPAKRTVKLTGTLRGKERDELVETPLFKRFLRDGGSGETVYLVCTSAGEVGVNISAQHMICDLSTYESMAQRLGRVNRFGEFDDCVIDVVHATFDEAGDEEDLEERRRRTLLLLQKLDGNASPKSLGDLPPSEREAAFSPKPDELDTSRILFDAWSLTSIRGKLPGRPPLDEYLHGRDEWEPPETHVAWRQEVDIVMGDLREKYNPEDLLEDYPLKPHELLRDRSKRVYKHLVTLAERHPDNSIWLVDDDGAVLVTTLKKLADDKRKEGPIEGMTALLGPSTGGLRDGFLDGSAESVAGMDVADDWLNEEGEKRRRREWNLEAPPDNMRWIRDPIDLFPDADSRDEDTSIRRYWCWFERIVAAESDGSKSSRRAIGWQAHTDDVVRNGVAIGTKLGLSNSLAKVLRIAAEIHDLGKMRHLWQRTIGNIDPKIWLAKSGGKMRLRALTRYRHEFGSLLDAPTNKAFAGLNDDEKDLVLHLVAVHHGRGRPHFNADEAFDPSYPESTSLTASREIPIRYAKLQRRFGRWGLAYLESLLRAADYAASSYPSPEEEKPS
jgi:CRISPR-associated endonuclease/helicase Cas3